MITPTETFVAFWRWFGVGILALIVLTVIIVGGWQAGWWFTSQNATRQAELTQNGYSNQVTLRQQITAQIAEVETITAQLAVHPELAAADKPQRMAVAGIVCQDAAEITGTPLPAQQAAWVAANCAAGTVSPTSIYYQAGQP